MVMTVMCVTHTSGRSSVLRTAAPASSQLRLTLVGGAGVGGGYRRGSRRGFTSRAAAVGEVQG